MAEKPIEELNDAELVLEAQRLGIDAGAAMGIAEERAFSGLRAAGRMLGSFMEGEGPDAYLELLGIKGKDDPLLSLDTAKGLGGYMLGSGLMGRGGAKAGRWLASKLHDVPMAGAVFNPNAPPVPAGTVKYLTEKGLPAAGRLVGGATGGALSADALGGDITTGAATGAGIAAADPLLSKAAGALWRRTPWGELAERQRLAGQVLEQPGLAGRQKTVLTDVLDSEKAAVEARRRFTLKDAQADLKQSKILRDYLDQQQKGTGETLAAHEGRLLRSMGEASEANKAVNAQRQTAQQAKQKETMDAAQRFAEQRDKALAQAAEAEQKALVETARSAAERKLWATSSRALGVPVESNRDFRKYVMGTEGEAMARSQRERLFNGLSSMAEAMQIRVQVTKIAEDGAEEVMELTVREALDKLGKTGTVAPKSAQYRDLKGAIEQSLSGSPQLLQLFQQGQKQYATWRGFREWFSKNHPFDKKGRLDTDKAYDALWKNRSARAGVGGDLTKFENRAGADLVSEILEDIELGAP